MDALRTALEEVQIRARIMSVPVVDCGEEVLCDVFLQIANLAREALGLSTTNIAGISPECPFLTDFPTGART